MAQATIDKQRQEHYLALLKQRIYIKQLPALFDLIDQSFDHQTEKLLQNSLLIRDKRAQFITQHELAFFEQAPVVVWSKHKEHSPPEQLCQLFLI